MRITNRQLKKISEGYVKYITNIANSIFQLEEFPEAWKKAIIIMIPKYGKNPQFPQNYRPISLLSSIAKVIERVILKRIQDECEDRNIIPNEQYGFRYSHSTEQQALRLTETIITRFNQRHSCPIPRCGKGLR